VREHSSFASLAEALRRMAADKPAREAKPVLEQLAQLREPREPHASATAAAALA
jgi:hypothetical protein